MAWGKKKVVDVMDLQEKYEAGRRLHLLTKQDGWVHEVSPILENIKQSSMKMLRWAPHLPYTDVGQVALDRSYHSAVVETVETIIRRINDTIERGQAAGESLNVNSEDGL